MRTCTAKLAAASLAAGLVLAPAPAQKPSAEDDPHNAARLATLEEAMKDRAMERDAEAVQVLGELGSTFADLNQADRKRTLRAVSDVLSRGKLRPVEHDDVYAAAASALAKMEEAGARALVRAYESSRFPNKPEWLPLRVHLVRCIGQTRDPSVVDFLCERVSRSSYDEELAAAGEALAHYADTDQKVRDPIVKALISRLGEFESAANMAVLRADTPQSLSIMNAKKTLETIKDPWNASLRALTHQSFESGQDWQRWYNKNKSRKWVEERGS